MSLKRSVVHYRRPLALVLLAFEIALVLLVLLAHFFSSA